MDARAIAQSALDPQGPAASAIASLAWLMFAAGAVIFILVGALVAWSLLAPPPRRAWLARGAVVVAGGIVVPVLVLSALLVYTLFVVPPSQASPPAAIRIDVVGHQWWWRVRYVDAAGRPDFDTANEIRIPVGVAVDLTLHSSDVIHSFWVPSLAGKVDMIPGRVNRLRLVADREGVFRGQCAEYCGGPHAKMALHVVAEPAPRFEQWRDAQRRPAAAGTHASFMSHCSTCHTVRGTEARGALGPDLTHFGSRVSIGAGILPNDTDALARWIHASQQIKPGNLMPSIDSLSGTELRAVAEYVEGLK